MMKNEISKEMREESLAAIRKFEAVSGLNLIDEAGKVTDVGLIIMFGGVNDYTQFCIGTKQACLMNLKEIVDDVSEAQ